MASGPILTPVGRVVGVDIWKIVAQGFEGLSVGAPVDAMAARPSVRL